MLASWGCFTIQGEQLTSLGIRKEISYTCIIHQCYVIWYQKWNHLNMNNTSVVCDLVYYSYTSVSAYIISVQDTSSSNIPMHFFSLSLVDQLIEDNSLMTLFLILPCVTSIVGQIHFLILVLRALVLELWHWSQW